MQDVSDYYRYIENQIPYIIDELDDKDFINAVDNEIVDKVFNRVALEPLKLANIQQDTPVKTQVNSGRYRAGNAIKVEQIRFRIVYSFKPSKSFKKVIDLRKTPITATLYELKISEQNYTCEQIIDSQRRDEESTASFVNQQIETFKKEIENASAVIEQQNQILKQRISGLIENKRKTIAEDVKFINNVQDKIKIPLRIAEDPEEITKVPVQVKKDIAKIIKPRTPEGKDYYLDSEDVKTIIRIINYQCLNFERTPRVFGALNENDLRDIILSTLNAVFKGAATGETFSNKGKTDIYLRVTEGNVFIAECKLWNGAQLFIDTLKQLFGYLTWRETYGVLINFCKRKDMTSVITSAKEAIQAEESFINYIDERTGSFVTRHKHPEDNNKTIDVYSLFYKI